MPDQVARLLERFSRLGRDEKMAALVSHARKLEPLPERLVSVSNSRFSVPECQTPVRIIPEFRDGLLHFYADIDVRQSPTVAAFLSIVFSVVNDHPPATTLALPSDFVRTIMKSIGLGTREVGLEAIVAHLQRGAREHAASS